MNSSRRVALSLGLASLFGGGLLFSFRVANGQPSNTAAFSNSASGPISNSVSSTGVSPSSGGAAGFSTVSTAPVASPPLKQTIGISPAQPVRQQVFNVFGGTGVDSPGSESYDLQSQNVYSLLRQRGVPIPNVLYPTSTAKPSFIVERLIVLSVTGAGSGGAGAAAPAQPSAPSGAIGERGGRAGAGGAAAAPKGPTDAERTVTAVRRVVEAEISRGSGRLGGDHRRKLQFLRAALVSLEQANQTGSIVAGAIGGAIPAGQSGNGQGQTKIDPREIFYGTARRYARRADLLVPKGF